MSTCVLIRVMSLESMDKLPVTSTDLWVSRSVHYLNSTGRLEISGLVRLFIPTEVVA